MATVPWEALQGLGPTLEPPLAAVLAGEPAERVLDRLLRAHRAFTAEQRAVAAESVFGVGLWRRRLRARLGHPDAPPLHLLAALAVDLGQRPDAPRWLGVDLPPLLPLADWRDRHSVPDWLAATLERAVGAEAPALAAAFNRPGPVCLRVNRLRTTREALAAALCRQGVTAEPGRWAPDALLVTSPRPNLLGLGSELLGAFEVQDEGSQLLGQLTGAQPGDEVLDLCAGAGGKALQLAALVGAQGRVHAADLDLPRLERLRTRAAKADARVLLHGREPPAALRVPRVLVDAPCSELGVLRRGPDVRWRVDPSAFAALPALQLELVERGARHLAPGGRLVYATCTLRPEENEAVVDAALARCPQLRLTRAELPAELLDARGCLRLVPHRHGTDGFFAAVFSSSP